LRVRKATIEDAEQLSSLLKEIGWFASFRDHSARESTECVKKQLALGLADDSHSISVAEDDHGKIIGYVSVHWIPYLFMSGREGYVSELFVRETARDQGVGGQLLGGVQAEARRRGCARLSLINLRNRESYLRQFYVKAGWHERGEAANFIYPLP
jgi:GNAT superfamily N-acetyltransferase